MPVTQTDIQAAIRDLNLTNRALCVHASLRSFGLVEGGAQTIVAGLRTERCTVLVPASAWSYFAVKPKPYQLPERNGGSAEEWKTYFEAHKAPMAGTKRVYHPHSNKLDKSMGAIPAAVVANPERVRGNHPLFSFAALGPLADTLIGPQTPLNVYGPFQALVEQDGVVVLMGVDLTSATLIHYAEAVAGRALFRRWANDGHGDPMEVAVGGCSDGFETFSPYLAAIEQSATVGSSRWRIFSAQQMIDCIVPLIQENPPITQCIDSACSRCRDATQGGPLLAQRPYA